MRIRQKTALVLTVAGVLALSACTGSGSGTPSASSGTPSAGSELVWDDAAQSYGIEQAVASGQQPLTVWVEYEKYGAALKAAFEKAHPGVNLEYRLVPKSEADTKLALDGPAGNGPDVFTTNYDHLANAVKASLAGPLGKYSKSVAARAGENFTNAVTIDHTMYGVPISTESIALFYNRTLLKKLTGSAEPATRWSEIKNLAATYNNAAANQWTIRFGTAYLYYAYPMLAVDGWRAFPDGNMQQPGFDSPNLTAGLENFASLRDMWDVPSADVNYDSVENAFALGATPYVITGPWVFSDYDAKAKAGAWEYGVAPLPTSDGSAAKTMGGIAVASVSTYSKYPGAARVLANFMSTVEGATALYSSLGAIPALTAEMAAKIPGLNEDKHAAAILKQSQNATFIDSIPEYFWKTGDAMVAGVWDGTLPVAQAQQKAITDFTAASDLAK